MQRSFFKSHQRRKQPEKVLQEVRDDVVLAVLLSDFLRNFQGFQKIIFHFHHGGAVVQPNTAFEMQVQASEIQIRGSDRGGAVIGNKCF